MSDKYYDETQVQDIIADMSDKCRMPVLGAGGGFAPIGTRGYFEGQTAPQGWLICDGSTQNIADYPDLATYIASQQGSVNYYGGNGTTTFGLPTMNGMPSGGVDTPDEHIIGERREIVDGVLKQKPVYEKTIDFGALPNNTTKLVDTNITNLEKCISFTGVGMYGSSQAFSLPFIYNTQTSTIIHSLEQSGAKVRIITFSDFSTYTAYSTVQYTKTTDTWQPVQEGHSSDGNGIFCIKASLSDKDYNIDNPTNWPANQEIELANGYYGYRATGNMPAIAAGSGASITINDNLVFSKIFNSGGSYTVVTNNKTIAYLVNVYGLNSDGTFIVSGSLRLNGSAKLRFEVRSGVITTTTSDTYDIWFTYTK